MITDFFQRRRGSLFLFFSAVIFFLPAIFFLFQNGYPSMHDDVQIYRLIALNHLVKDGQIPPIWADGLMYGYGYPLFSFIYPLPYYFAELFHFLGFTLIDSVKIVFILGMFMAFLFSYILGRKLWGNSGGIITSLLFTYAPYHAVNVYVRGTLGESTAMAFIPAVFLAIYLIFEKYRRRVIIFGALSYSFLILSHQITALFTSFFLAVFALFLFLKKKKIVHLFQVLLLFLLGIGISAYYWLPAILERKYVILDKALLKEGYDYKLHFVGFKQLLYSPWGYGGSVPGPWDGLSFQIGVIHLILFVLVLIPAVVFYRQKKRTASLIFFFAVSFLLVAFLTNQKSQFLWEIIPLLLYAPFPWRFLTLSVFFVSIIGGGISVFLPKTKRSHFLILLLGFLIMLLNFKFFRPEHIRQIQDDDYLKRYGKGDIVARTTTSANEYLPIWAENIPKSPPSSQFEFLTANGEIKNYETRPNHKEFEVEVTKSGSARISAFYYPGWKVYIDNKEELAFPEKETGLINFEISKGTHNVIVKFEDTQIRLAGKLISSFSLGILLLWKLRLKI